VLHKTRVEIELEILQKNFAGYSLGISFGYEKEVAFQ
jgi:hypothetical protein